jgi:hypothetical protein
LRGDRATFDNDNFVFYALNDYTSEGTSRAATLDADATFQTASSAREGRKAQLRCERITHWPRRARRSENELSRSSALSPVVQCVIRTVVYEHWIGS